MTFDRIKELRNLIPHGIITIDGGISIENAKDLISAGADNLVIGSAILNSKNIEENFKKLVTAALTKESEI